jgi:hypothetical protein
MVLIAFVGAVVFFGIAFYLQTSVFEELRKNLPEQLRNEVMLRTAVQGHVWLPGISKAVRRKYILLLVCGCAFLLCVAAIATVAGWPALIFWGLALFGVSMTLGTAIKHRDQLL